MESYFIKPGYICNPVKSLDTSQEDVYWTEHRIASSRVLQYQVYELAFREFRKRGFSSVLDIGCGPAVKMRHFFFDKLENVKVTLVDQPSTSSLVARLYPEATFVASNLAEGDLDLKEKFDLIICSDVIEHLENPDLLIEAIKRHVNEDGIMIISTPDRDMRRGLGNNKSPNPEHVREWNMDEFARYLKSHNLNILTHVNLPSFRLSRMMMILHRIFYKKIKKKSWYPCQTAVVNLK